MRRSLVLYAVLAREGYPVRIHFGIRPRGETLDGHSWITVQGRPFSESLSADVFRIIYSHPADFDPSALHVGDFASSAGL